MAITREMVLVQLEDLEPYAEARALARRARELASEARHPDHRATLAALAGTAVALAATVAEALRAWGAAEEARRFRDATALVDELRALAWDAYTVDALAPHAFDELMAATARCRRELDRAVAAARRRALRLIDA
jgi:hypothetical protein